MKHKSLNPILFAAALLFTGCTNVSSVYFKNLQAPYEAGMVGIGAKIGRNTVINGIDIWEGGLPNRPYAYSNPGIASFSREGLGAINHEPKRDLAYIAKFAAEHRADGVLIVGEHIEVPQPPNSRPKKYESMIQLIKYL